MVGLTEQKWFTPHLYIQGWHGFGEALIDDNDRTTALRAGIALRR
jgi:outer membrane phospholipase A